MTPEAVLLKNRGDFVGFGKHVIDPHSGMFSTTIHGHPLLQFAKENEDLVSIHGVQIFTEFEDQPYPYSFKGFDDPPVLLGDLNKTEKAFKQVIAWDRHKLIEGPQLSFMKLDSTPRAISVKVLDNIRGSISRSRVKVRFPNEKPVSTDEILPETRRKFVKPIYRSYFEEARSNSARISRNEDAHSEEEEQPESSGVTDKHPGSGKIQDNDFGFSSFSSPNGPCSPGQLMMSDRKYRAILASISDGTFDESVDQVADETEALEERSAMREAEKETRTNGSRILRIDDAQRASAERQEVLSGRRSEPFVERGSSSDRGLSPAERIMKRSRRQRGRCNPQAMSRLRQVRRTRRPSSDKGLSPAERITKRLREQQERRNTQAMSRSRQVSHNQNNSHPQRASNGGPEDGPTNSFSGFAEGSPVKDVQQPNSYALQHERFQSAEVVAHPSGRSNLSSHAQLLPVSDNQDIAHSRSLDGGTGEASLLASMDTAVQAQPPHTVFPAHDLHSVRMMPLKARQYRFKTRQRGSPKRIGRRKVTRMSRLEQSVIENPFKTPRPCCNGGCFYLVDPEYTVIQYRKFLKMDRQDRKRALKSMYIPSARAFWFSGIYVCTRFISRGFGFSNQLQCAVKGTPRARASSSILAVPRLNVQDTKKDQIILYLRGLAERIGDSLPTRPHTNLPLMSKKHVFERFIKFNRNFDGRDCPSLSYWLHTWKQSCSDIKTHRHHGFTKCDLCERIREGFETAENERM